jgi:hypothetical protein
MLTVSALTCLLFQALPDTMPTRNALVIPERIQFPSVKTVIERGGMDLDQQIAIHDDIILFLQQNNGSPSQIERFQKYKERLVQLKK